MLEVCTDKQVESRGKNSESCQVTCAGNVTFPRPPWSVVCQNVGENSRPGPRNGFGLFPSSLEGKKNKRLSQ